MKAKKGVSIFGVRPEMSFAMIVVHQVYRELDNMENCVITSCTDGEHSKGSDHYVGLALDVRVWGFNREQRALATEMILERLTDEFEVFDEDTHIHIGFDPQKGLNMKE